MRHLLSTGALGVLALAGSTAAQAQVVVERPAVVAPAYVAPTYVAPTYAAPVVVAPTQPYVAVAPSPTYIVPGYNYAYGGDYADDYAYDYAYAPQPYVAAPLVNNNGYTTVNSVTGRRCTVKPDGYHWCWTP